MDARQIPLSLSPRIFPFFPGKGIPLPVTWGKLRGRDVGKMWDEVVPWKMKNVGNYKKTGLKRKRARGFPDSVAAESWRTIPEGWETAVLP